MRSYAPKQGLYKDWIKGCKCTYFSFKEWTRLMKSVDCATDPKKFRWNYNVFFTFLGDGII